MDKFCRICSRSDEFKKFDLATISQISNVRIDDMLVYCTQQQINTEDSLPQHICAECFTALNSAFVFRKLTYHSEHGFRQMINSNLTASEPMPSSMVFIPPPVEIVDHILPDVAVQDDDLVLEEPLTASILPIEIVKALAIEENLIRVSNQTDENIQIDKTKSRGSRSSPGRTTYLCKDCGYSTQSLFNFKRHQINQKHFTYSKIVTRQPLNLIRHLIKPFIKPKVSKQPKEPTIRKRQQNAQKKIRKAGRNRGGTRTLYRCDDCGYQNYIGFNFRRHQKNMNHSKISTFREPATSTELTSDAILKTYRECQSSGNNRDSDYVYSDEALSICRILGIKRRHVQRKTSEQMVKVKTEPTDDEAPIAQVAVGDGPEDTKEQLNYVESVIKTELL